MLDTDLIEPGPPCPPPTAPADPGPPPETEAALAGSAGACGASADTPDYGMPVHPACDVIPLMDADSLAKLADSIRVNGLQNPIVVHEGQVIDGRNRLLACRAAGVEPRFLEWREINRGGTSLPELLEWIYSVNVVRSHRTPDQIAAAMVLARSWEEAEAAQQRQAGPAQANIVEASMPQPTSVNGTVLAIAAIRIDGGTQPRAGIDHEAVTDYAEAMKCGTAFPPLVVFCDGATRWLADGFHRIKAAEQAGVTEIACDIRQGTQQDAQWYSYSANQTHGLRRSNTDKQRAVKAALTHPKGAGLSNRQIAAHVGCDESTVRDWREKLTAGIPQSPKRTGRDGRTTNTAKIGKRAGSSAAAAAPPAPPAAAPPTLAPAPAPTPARPRCGSYAERMAQSHLSFMEGVRRYVQLIERMSELDWWRGEAERRLGNATQSFAREVEDIERRAVAEDPLNADRLRIERREVV